MWPGTKSGVPIHFGSIGINVYVLLIALIPKANER
ncbi:protein of unknown function [Methylocaldum szegediense]|uniref:Uncharacterized protein n=1 Tax=Methylocaldum szegediense TaxID=73780 RepID=A0ABM9I1K5_9GAMM|nr:protein of unknown function [Methylocaldum szegediense]